MNHIYRSIWNDQTGTFVAVSEISRSGGQRSLPCANASSGKAASGTSLMTMPALALKTFAVFVALAFSPAAWALPTGGLVAEGSAGISSGAGTMTVSQSTGKAVINWQGFNIGQGETVNFQQPNASSVILNRVTGSDPSSIMGNLTANGQVFLVNPNGIVFGSGSSVNVGGLVASTLGIADADFMAGNYKFSGTSHGDLVTQGVIAAKDSSYIALLGARVTNQGTISARLGSVALAAGTAVTLDVAGDKLLNVTVNQDAVNTLVQNGGLIRADGGNVLMTTQAAGSLLANAVNNTGVIQAQTVENVNGTIKLLGGMGDGTVNVAGTLDASAPNGNNGGFIETSAAHVRVANSVKVTTAAPMGLTGSWLIDPQDFVIGSGTTDNISGATLSGQLVTNSITISTATGPGATLPGNGDIFVNDAVTWTASGGPTTLTLNAVGSVFINRAITATNGNLEVCCGQDINVNAAITTVNGSMLLSAGRNLNVNAAVTTTDGNIMMCAANDVNVNGAITLTRGSSIPGQSLGLPQGLVLNAGYGGTGPGTSGGTLAFSPTAPLVTVTGPNAPVTIYYNPVSYTTPTNYSGKFTLTSGATLTQYMLVFAAGGDKAFDGTTAANLSSLKGNPDGVTLVAGPGSAAAFDSAAEGNDKTISYSGYSLGGPNAGKYALANSCCGPVVSRTTANITPAPGGGGVYLPVGALPSGSVPAFVWPIIQPVPPAIIPPGPIPPWFVPPGAPLTIVPQNNQSNMVLVVEQPALQQTRYIAPIRPPKQERN